jgi:hypothetical protein
MQKFVGWCALVALILGLSPASAKHHSRHHHHFSHIAPHHQPLRANNRDSGIGPTAGEKAVDRKINDICRKC